MIDSKKILNITSAKEFEKNSIKIFNYQFKNNTIYREFCNLTGKNPSDIKFSFEIPFFPIQFFKTHKIVSSNQQIQKTFHSSGTTKDNLSKHHVTDLKHYENCLLKIFMNFYGHPSKYNIIALLPTYHENKNSSLIYMVNHLIEKSKNFSMSKAKFSSISFGKSLKAFINGSVKNKLPLNPLLYILLAMI